MKPHSRSRPPQCVSEALCMSPPHRLRRRRKKEDFDVRIGKEVVSWTWRQSWTWSCIYVLLLTTCSHDGGGGGGLICLPIRQQLLLDYIVTLDLFLLYDHCNCFLVIKRGCFNDLGESVMQQQDGLPFLLTTLVGFPLNFKGKQCH